MSERISRASRPASWRMRYFCVRWPLVKLPTDARLTP